MLLIFGFIGAAVFVAALIAGPRRALAAIAYLALRLALFIGAVAVTVVTERFLRLSLPIIGVSVLFIAIVFVCVMMFTAHSEQ